MKKNWSLTTVVLLLIFLVSTSVSFGAGRVMDCDPDTENCENVSTASTVPMAPTPVPAVQAAPVTTLNEDSLVARLVNAVEGKLSETRKGFEEGLTKLEIKSTANAKATEGVKTKVGALEKSVNKVIGSASASAKTAAKAAEEATKAAEEANGFAKEASDAAAIANSSAGRAEDSAKAAAESAVDADADAGRAEEAADEAQMWGRIALAVLAVMVVGVVVFLFATRKKQSPVNQRHADKAKATAEKET